MDDKIKHINPNEVSGEEQFRDLVSLLLNTVEGQASQISKQEELIVELRDEINRLKGEQGRPKFKDKSKSKDYSSQSREKKPSQKGKKGSKKARLIIDRRQEVDLCRSLLPEDARLKYYDELIQQEVSLVRTNTLYRVAVYYSPSLGRTFRPSMPADYAGEFGANLQALLHSLHYACDVTQGRLKALLESIGVSISKGSIDNILKSGEDWACEERRAILRAGIEHSPYAQTDSTGNKEKGKAKSTHVICGAFFSTFYTLQGRKRFDVLTALQGHPEDGIGLSYNEHTQALLQQLRVSLTDQDQLQQLFANGLVYNRQTFCDLIAQKVPWIAKKKNIFSRIIDAFALGHYFVQQQMPVVDLLLTDDATEYQKLARLGRALCWVHDARPYNKLSPRLDYHQQILRGFKDQYWSFYHQLLEFKQLKGPQQQLKKKQLETQFIQLFSQNTQYAQLDQQLKVTLANKDKLLLVLDYPALPLHNNAAELAARRMVRKRDVSFQTMSPKGTRVRDAFLSIVHTAAKLRVNALAYLADRITGQFNMMPILPP